MNREPAPKGEPAWYDSDITPEQKLESVAKFLGVHPSQLSNVADMFGATPVSDPLAPGGVDNLAPAQAPDDPGTPATD